MKLSDFGLARHVVESESLNMTQAGAIVGTPLYMSPEQCSGRGPIGPATDVYAMGVTLFHLLAGRPPFVGETSLGVIAMHRNEPPPPLRDLNAAVSDGVGQIVAKAMAKRPEGRYADAGEMLLDLERLLRGEPTGLEVHPRLPDADPRDVIRYDFRWELDASPRQLWPHVSNTERLNRAVGLPAVDFTDEPDPDGGVRRFGQFRKAGIVAGWREHPFEWVEGRRMGVLREYRKGPFKWFVSIVELPAPGRGGHHAGPQRPGRAARDAGTRPGRRGDRDQGAPGGGPRLPPDRRDADGQARPRSRRSTRSSPPPSWRAAVADASTTCSTASGRTASTRSSWSGWAISWPGARRRRSRGSGRWRWRGGWGSTPTRWWPRACTGRPTGR